MTEDYKPCDIGKNAARDVTKPTRELCFALIYEETGDIINVYSPGTFWTKARDGARNLECSFGRVACEVSYEILPMFKVYKSFTDIEMSAMVPGQPVTQDNNIDNFYKVDISPTAKRKFKSVNSTQFIGIKVGEEVIKIFPRGTSIEQISNLSFVLQGDIVLVKAKAVYNILGFAKIDKTYEQLRHN